MPIVTNLHNEMLIVTERPDGLGVEIKVEALAHHCEDAGHYTNSVVTLSPDQGGRLIHALCEALGLACEITPLTSSAFYQERRAMLQARLSGVALVKAIERRRIIALAEKRPEAGHE